MEPHEDESSEHNRSGSIGLNPRILASVNRIEKCLMKTIHTKFHKIHKQFVLLEQQDIGQAKTPVFTVLFPKEQ